MAQAGAGHSLAALLKGKVVVMALISMSVAVASCVVNDYFDFAAGVDALNAPNKVTPRTTILLLLPSLASFLPDG